jgi:ectoine hydrolase
VCSWASRPTAFLDAEAATLEGQTRRHQTGNTCEDIAREFFDVLAKNGIIKDNRTGYPIGLSCRRWADAP